MSDESFGGLGKIETLRQDLCYSLRTLWARPGFTLVVVVTLELGIGANATIFTWIKAVLLEPLPGIQRPDELIEIWGDTRNNSAYSGGHYNFPVHLEQRATRTFNVSQIVESGIPDPEGNVIPVGVAEGSAKIMGSHADDEHVLVAWMPVSTTCAERLASRIVRPATVSPLGQWRPILTRSVCTRCRLIVQVVSFGPKAGFHPDS